MNEILLLKTPDCHNCGKVERMIREKILPDYPKLRFKVMDIVKHPEMLQKYMFMSSPGIVINGKLEYSGGASEEEIRKKLK